MPETLFLGHNEKPNADYDWMKELSESISYGCVFCRTGQERIVARSLSDRIVNIWAVPVSQMKHKSRLGKKSLEEHVLMPGYIFFKVYDPEFPIHSIQQVPGVIKLLFDSSGDWRLTNDDGRFAEWVFAQGGLIGLSKAYTVGDRICILSGPLKDYEGNIVKIDRRSRNGQVEIRFQDRVWKVWLAFDLVDTQITQDQKTEG